MKLINKQKNRNFKLSNSGFTIIETMVAVFILTTSLAALLNLTASSAVTARYSRNEIIANYLLQEAVDFIRNDRDTIAFQGNVDGSGWSNFKSTYSSCFFDAGCIIEPIKGNSSIQSCLNSTSGINGCPLLKYSDNLAENRGFYSYEGTTNSVFRRQIKMYNNADNPEDEIDIVVTLEWQNGGVTRSRTLNSSLLNWQVNY